MYPVNLLDVFMYRNLFCNYNLKLSIKIDCFWPYYGFVSLLYY